MKLPALITSDLHLVASASTEYRWHFFDWLREEIKAEKVKTLLILGDLTDAKDYHPAELVNRIVKVLNSLPVERIVILAGNHDWLREGHEFFRFLNVLPHVEFITAPTEDKDVEGELCYFLPYSKNPRQAWAGWDLSHYRYVFMHQTIKGSIASNGQAMEGEDLPDLSAAGKVYSGDIHVPQVIGPVEYVGSPYHVHFGDDFKPRCVLIEKGNKAVDLFYRGAPRRVSLRVKSLRELDRRLDDSKAGDMMRVVIELDESEKHEWHRIRREAQEMLRDAKVDLHGLALEVRKSERRLDALGAPVAQKKRSPEDVIYRFAEAEGLTGEAYEAAMEVMR
jgi:DNA repair exonuclease SbcCD nuclease subunit